MPSTLLSPAVRWLLLLALSAWGGVVRGQPCPDGRCPLVPVPPRASVLHPAVVRLEHREPDGDVAWGSGAVVSCDGTPPRVLTCAHLFSGRVGRIVVRLSTGRRLAAALVAHDREADLALLEVDPALLPAPLNVASDDPRPGAWTWGCGYGESGVFHARPGRVVGYTLPLRTHPSLILTGAARSGDSGGPIFDQQGQLTAVLWGTSADQTYAVCCRRVREFFSRLGLGRGDPPAGPPPPLVNLPPELPAPQLPIPAPAAPGVLPAVPAPAVPPLAAPPLPPAPRAPAAPASPFPPALPAALPAAVGSWLSGRAAALLVAAGLPGWIAALLVWLVGRRARRRLASGARNRPPRPPLHDDYAAQLAAVFAHSGRSPLQDATLGREYDQEVARAAASSDAGLARWAQLLRDRVHTRFHRIHMPDPAPAEPLPALRD
jgi:hypothetical protein